MNSSDITKLIISFINDAARNASSSVEARRYGEGVSIGYEDYWVQLSEPIRVKEKDNGDGQKRFFLNGSDNSLAIVFSPQSYGDYKVRIYLSKISGGDSIFSIVADCGNDQANHFYSVIKRVQNTAYKSLRNKNLYISYAAALALFGLSDGYSARMIIEKYRQTMDLTSRMPFSKKYFESITKRAQETLFADLKSTPGYNRCDSYDDPMRIHSAWHASKVLEVNENSSSELVNSAFRNIAKIVHPDHAGNRYFFQLAVKARNILTKRDFI
jgi:hypothetical protein